MIISKTKLYWILQIFGWLGYVGLIGYFNFSSYNNFSTNFIFSLISIYVICLLVSHGYRSVIVKYNLLNLHLSKLIIPIFLGAFALSIVTYFLKWFLVDIIIEQNQMLFSLINFIFGISSWFVIYLLWSLFYFLFHYVTNYKNEEIKNLKWEAKKNEIELNRLISQLNPHFIFNAMNSIRALIDEDPKSAKIAINQLSNVLRNSLLMGKKKLIFFSEELKLVEDYLNLEKTRFEEKLTIRLTINENTKNFLVPPLMIQTLVENAIKHGTSKLPKGGIVEITASLEADKLKVIIYNSGYYDEQANSETGFGLINTKQRLELLYGKEALFSIKNEDDKVKTLLLIPHK